MDSHAWPTAKRPSRFRAILMALIVVTILLAGSTLVASQSPQYVLTCYAVEECGGDSWTFFGNCATCPPGYQQSYICYGGLCPSPDECRSPLDTYCGPNNVTLLEFQVRSAQTNDQYALLLLAVVGLSGLGVSTYLYRRQ